MSMSNFCSPLCSGPVSESACLCGCERVDVCVFGSCVSLYARVCVCVCVCVFDYLTALPWFMCLGPVRAVLSLCEKNHSFPRVEDERVFRLQTPAGLCGLDCLSLFHHHRVIYSLKNTQKKTVRLWHRLSRDGRDVARSWTISLIKTLSFCIIDLAWAAIGGSFWVRVCVCAKAWKHILLCINMRSIKNAQLGMVWKEIYLKVMVHSCTSFGVWPWQIVVVELVIARKHTRATHTLINIYINISALQMCAHFLHTNTSKHE